MSDCEKVVLDYMLKQARPYNVQNVVDNLRNAYPKKNVLQALNNLADRGELERKLYGKTAMFIAPRVQKGVSPELNEDEELVLAQLRAERDSLYDRISELRRKARLQRTNKGAYLLGLEKERNSIAKEIEGGVDEKQLAQLYELKMILLSNQREKQYPDSCA